MPVAKWTEKIDVRASADAAFAAVTGPMIAVEDHPKAMSGHRPISSGPLREGFRWQQTLVHERRVCRTDWVVTELKPPWLLEQTLEHLCAVHGSVSSGGERWELEVGVDGSTIVTLRTWVHRPGLLGWLRTMLGGSNRTLAMKKRLAYVQFEAERGG